MGAIRGPSILMDQKTIYYRIVERASNNRSLDDIRGLVHLHNFDRWWNHARIETIAEGQRAKKCGKLHFLDLQFTPISYADRDLQKMLRQITR